MRALEKFWWRRDEPAWTEAWAFPLSLLSLGFHAGATLRARVITPQRARVPVISIGNLAVGGAGKTPVAMLLCEMLHARGHRPALLSRGHGRRSRAPVLQVSAGQGPLPGVGAREAGDEPLLIARRCPFLTVLVGPERAALARAAEERGCDVLVLDDGLQQRALASDLELVVLDAQNPLGNRRRLPRGPLREGAEAFERVGARGLVWLANARDSSQDADELQPLLASARRAGLRGPVRSAAIPRLPPGVAVQGLPTYLLAGIARPERFEASLRSLGADLRGRAFFPDHHRFSDRELARVRAAARAAGAVQIATTEKDAARLSDKLAHLSDKSLHLSDKPGEELPIVPIPIDLQLLEGRAALESALDALALRPTQDAGEAR